MTKVLDFFGIGGRQKVQRSRTAAIQSGVADVVKLSDSIKRKVEEHHANPAMDLAVAMKRRRRRKAS